MYIRIGQVKHHLNIDKYFTDDDEYIMDLVKVAEKIVEKHIDCSLSELAKDNGDELPSPIIQAILLMVGNLYANRESVAFAQSYEVPKSYEYLLSMYVNYNKQFKDGGIF